MEKLILEKLEHSETGRERFVTTDLNVLKAVRELGNQGLVQWKVKMQPAQPLGLTVHDDQLNTLSDWNEKMVCQIIGAEQTAWNCKAHDGILKDGTKVEIKHCTWYVDHNGEKRINIGLSKKDNADVFAVVVAEADEPNSFLHRRFFVFNLQVLKQILGSNKTHINTSETSDKFLKLLKYECTLAELAELKHGYKHFLKMKGKVEPIEPPKESIQYVIDVWKPNKFNLMPYDARYEDSSWYAEFAVAQLIGGTVTEQRCAGYDVVDQYGFKYQVKIANISPSNYLKSGIKYQILFNAIKSHNVYDVFVGLFWDSLENKESNDLTSCKLIITPKEVAEVLKTPYHANKPENGAMKFATNQDGKYTKNAAIHKFKPFMFTIDHLAELGEIGYEQFYVKYLKEACEKVLGVENKIGSDDSNGNQIDLKPKFPIQFQSSKRTNQADQRSA